MCPFSYPSSPYVLRIFNLSVNPGEVVAIVGPSGAGKSSFANLLLRFYDPIQGFITLDGIDIRQFKISALRSISGLSSKIRFCLMPAFSRIFAMDDRRQVLSKWIGRQN